MRDRDSVSHPPRLSVIVPTYGRPLQVRQLLEGLARQSASPGSFEVIVVDDGSPEPVGDLSGTPYALTILRQDNAGPAAARNLALESARAPLCLILNDDAVLACELIEKHLAVHDENEREGSTRIAVLGCFHFTREAIAASPFVELLDRTDLLFDFSRLAHGKLHGWPFFWTCNISLPTELVREVGGFDAENFPDIVEDVELGWRLAQRGLAVLYRDDLVCTHDHMWTIGAYFERARRLGRNLARMYEKHGDPTVLRLVPGTRVDEAALRPMQATCETLWPQFLRAREVLAKVEEQCKGSSLDGALVAQLEALVRRVHAVPFYRGVLEQLTGSDLGRVLEQGPLEGQLTSVIVLSQDGLARTKRCLEALRRARQTEHPIEILCVDNGSRDGSREYLTAQTDVLLIANDENEGAPRARNQALAHACGEYVVFLDNDAIVTPGWLGRMLYHLEVDPLAACVGPLSDRAAHGQQIAEAPGSDDAAPEARAATALEERAQRLARECARSFRHASLLSSFCLLVRRTLIDRIGGFDERFAPWGFEDDDFTLRAALAGYHNRIALDVFVHHARYQGQKRADRAQLLTRNWQRFRDKWALADDAAHGDYSGLAPCFERPWGAEELYVPLSPIATVESTSRSLEEPCATS